MENELLNDYIKADSKLKKITWVGGSVMGVLFILALAFLFIFETNQQRIKVDVYNQDDANKKLSVLLEDSEAGRMRAEDDKRAKDKSLDSIKREAEKLQQEIKVYRNENDKKTATIDSLNSYIKSLSRSELESEYQD